MHYLNFDKIAKLFIFIFKTIKLLKKLSLLNNRVKNNKFENNDNNNKIKFFLAQFKKTLKNLQKPDILK